MLGNINTSLMNLDEINNRLYVLLENKNFNNPEDYKHEVETTLKEIINFLDGVEVEFNEIKEIVLVKAIIEFHARIADRFKIELNFLMSTLSTYNKKKFNWAIAKDS